MHRWFPLPLNFVVTFKFVGFSSYPNISSFHRVLCEFTSNFNSTTFDLSRPADINATNRQTCTVFCCGLVVLTQVSAVLPMLARSNSLTAWLYPNTLKQRNHRSTFLRVPSYLNPSMAQLQYWGVLLLNDQFQ
jgi:hypothetical protein